MRWLALAAMTIMSSAAAAQTLPIQIHVNAIDYPDGVTPGADSYRVRVRYRLDRVGRIADCTVARSSGLPALDAGTCRILQSRARFRPPPTSGMLEFIWLGADSLRPQVVRGEPITVGLFFSTDDYPRGSVSNDEEGTVAYAVQVSPRGAPVGCTVTESSGYLRLDRRTCEVIMQRGAYIPATDGNGPLGGVAHGKITWRRPG